MKPAHTPSVISAARLTTLVSSFVVALASGTNYVFSAYAPQLGTRLRISHTKLNLVALAGNVGVYSTGPILGKVVDRRGPRPLLAAAFLFLLVGYSGIRYFYNSPDTGNAERLSTFSFCILVACSFLTGAGGNGGLTSSINATAKSFPDQMRASTTGLVISGFGLSAFLFSTVAHIVYPGDTSEFLLLLSLGTSLPMIIGFFFIRPIPLPDAPGQVEAPRPRRTSFADFPRDGFSHAAGVDAVLTNDSVIFEHDNDSRTDLLGAHRHHHHPHTNEESEFLHVDHDDTRSPARRTERAHSLELARSPPPPGAARHRSISRATHKRSHSRVIEVMHEIHGKELFKSSDFWTLFTLLSLLSGTGLMYINNVGSISQALFSKENPEFDEVESAKWQSMQVSIISIANCVGRIFIGVSADFVKNTFGAPRSYCICFLASVFVVSQVVATQIEVIESLWYVSAFLGFAYGCVFGLFPTIAIEWFGLGHFSENWGFISLSPMLGGNLFSLAFGRNLDRHAIPVTPRPPLRRAGLPSEQLCFEGRECYVSSLYLTAFACTVALALSIYAAWKDRKRMIIVNVDNEDLEEVIWEDDEE